jgi:hypothetical protein
LVRGVRPFAADQGEGQGSGASPVGRWGSSPRCPTTRVSGGGACGDGTAEVRVVCANDGPSAFALLPMQPSSSPGERRVARRRESMARPSHRSRSVELRARPSPVPWTPWSRYASRGWNPNPRLYAGAANSFSECASPAWPRCPRPPRHPCRAHPPRGGGPTRGPPPAPARIAATAASSCPARSSMSRADRRAEATGPNNADPARSTDVSAGRSPPGGERHRQVQDDLSRVVGRPRPCATAAAPPTTH